MEFTIKLDPDFIKALNQKLRENKMETTWPLAPNFTDSNVVVNQRMVGQLVRRQGTTQDPKMIQLGKVVDDLRRDADISRQEMSRLSGLDSGFLTIVEAGKALPSEINTDVLTRLVNSLNGALPLKLLMDSFKEFYE